MLFSFATIFFTACALLSYEIFLMRLLSITSWSHYAYMVVSLAMLGVALSGVSLVLFPNFFKRWREKIILTGCFVFSVTIPLTFYINQRLRLNYLYLLWDWRQFIYLGIHYLLYSIPFVIGSMILALFFRHYTKNSGQVYAANLLGSSIGVLMAVGVMCIIPPEYYLAVSATAAALAGLFWGMRSSSGFKRTSILILFLAVVCIHCYFSPSSLTRSVSEYKGLSWLLRLQNTKVVHKLYSPLGLIHVVKGKSIRLAHGLSINFKGDIPPQKALVIDADSPSPLYDFRGDFNDFQFLDCEIYSAPYKLIKNPKVLIIGVRGGNDVLLAKSYQSRSIILLEMNPKVIRAIKDTSGISFKHIYQTPDVKVITKEARGYLEQTKEKVDLIQLNPGGSFVASGSGVYAQNEDYLNTVEAYQLFYQRLSSQGILMASTWMKTPARDGVKLFATGFEALKESGVEQPEKNLALIRTWDIVMLLMKKTPFTTYELETLKDFCSMRNFDICYVLGISQNEVNQFNKLSQPVYYHAAKNIINPLTRAKFYAEYVFRVNPATDDKPYFSNFFRWAALPHLIKTLGREWLPFAEHGYLVLLATFIQATILGVLFILVPLGILLRKNRNFISFFSSSVWLYFVALGFSYMLLEMALIQKFILFLHHPIYSSSVVIASFLLLSGIGSLLSKNFLQKNIRYQIIPFIAVICIGIFYSFSLDFIFSKFIWAHIYLRLLISFFLIAPLAFFMGMPFPFGMQKVVITGERNTGAAWGYNGFSSVVSTVAAPILAGMLGFRAVGIIGCLCYLTAMGIWIKNRNN